MIFLFATEREAQQFRLLCPHAPVEICGVGAAECAATTAAIITRMSTSGLYSRLVLGGIAGSYDIDDVAVSEVVEVIQEEIAALPPRFATNYRCEAKTSLRTVTSNSVNSSAERGERISEAQIENMEGATFMAICQRANIPHLQIRAVSNKVGDPFELWSIDDSCRALASTLALIYREK